MTTQLGIGMHCAGNW